jgi:hypothetical protein
MSKTLEQMIRDNADIKGNAQGTEFILTVSRDYKGKLEIYIHPSNKDGDTVDFYVKDNNLTPIKGD